MWSGTCSPQSIAVEQREGRAASPRSSTDAGGRSRRERGCGQPPASVPVGPVPPPRSPWPSGRLEGGVLRYQLLRLVARGAGPSVGPVPPPRSPRPSGRLEGGALRRRLPRLDTWGARTLVGPVPPPRPSDRLEGRVLRHRLPRLDASGNRTAGRNHREGRGRFRGRRWSVAHLADAETRQSSSNRRETRRRGHRLLVLLWRPCRRPLSRMPPARRAGEGRVRVAAAHL